MRVERGSGLQQNHLRAIGRGEVAFQTAHFECGEENLTWLNQTNLGRRNWR